MSKETVTILCCANASGNRRMKLSLIGKSAIPQYFKLADIHVDYYNQASAWMDREIFSGWFFEKCVPQVRENLRKQGLEENTVSILDNASSHPAEYLLKTEDGKI